MIRSMEFVQLLFSELSGSDDEMDVVAGEVCVCVLYLSFSFFLVRAYEQSLSRHHNFLVRGLFYVSTHNLHFDFYNYCFVVGSKSCSLQEGLPRSSFIKRLT